jgi:DNA-binding transcriptional ArsR family regulator
MSSTLVDVAQGLADPIRFTILRRLIDGPAAVSEFAPLTAEAQSKVSNGLAVLRIRRLVRAAWVGRQQLYEIPDPSVAQLVESLALIGGRSPAKLRPSPALAKARTCYDHLAGRLGVAIFDALVARGAIAKLEARYRGPLALGPGGPEMFDHLGIDLNGVRRERRRCATACGDWTEGRPHLGGALGAALWARSLERRWVVRKPSTRVVVVTETGRRGLSKHLGVRADHAPASIEAEPIG